MHYVRCLRNGIIIQDVESMKHFDYIFMSISNIYLFLIIQSFKIKLKVFITTQSNALKMTMFAKFN